MRSWYVALGYALDMYKGDFIRLITYSQPCAVLYMGLQSSIHGWVEACYHKVYIASPSVQCTVSSESMLVLELLLLLMAWEFSQYKLH